MALPAGREPPASVANQRSGLLPSLFDRIDQDRRLTVLHIGSALPETVDFFSQYRCRLHFVDLFAELPRLNQRAPAGPLRAKLTARPRPPETHQPGAGTPGAGKPGTTRGKSGLAVQTQTTIDEEPASPQQIFAELIDVPPGTRFDLCLFWDLFNFLDDRTLAALLTALRQHLHSRSQAHCLAVHSLKTDQSRKIYGISKSDQISQRPRPAALPGYRPRNRGQLARALECFSVTRSVLLAENRLELLLTAKPQERRE